MGVWEYANIITKKRLACPLFWLNNKVNNKRQVLNPKQIQNPKGLNLVIGA